MVVREHKSTCSYCGVGCGIVVSQHQNGKVTVRGDKDHPVNKGKLCSKGMNLHYVVNKQDDRLLAPYVRAGKGHPLLPAEWPEAINKVAFSFKKLIEKYGPDSVGFYISGQCLTEEYYAATKLAKGFWGTNNIDTNSRLCMSSAVVGYKKQLGEDAVPISYEDIELADCFFITGANPSWCHPILFQRLEEHKRKNPHVKVIVADPRRTQTCSIADIHLQIKPGTDVYLNNAIGRCLVEQEMIDLDFIEKHTNGFHDYLEKVFELNLEEAAQKCGIPVSLIEKTAKLIGTSNGFISMWAMGLNQSVIGVNKNLSLINLSLITGKIGKPGCGPFSLTGQPNAMGGREVGGMCNLLPAHRNLNDLSHRREVANFWGVEKIPEKVGYSATEMIEALNSGKMKAVWIICTNPMVSLPNSHLVEQALKKARMVVVQDISMESDTIKHADVIFPAAGWLEKEGTMTNSERRITYLNKVVNAPGEALPDYEIICRVARKMGYKGFNFKSPQELFDEYKQLTRGTNIDISDLDYEVLKQDGSIQWPYSAKNKSGTKRLFEDFQFYTPNRKAVIFGVDPKNQSEKTSDDYPFILTTGRIRDQWHTMTRTGKVNKLKRHIPDSFIQMHPIDARIIKLKDGDLVDVSSARGSVRVNLQLSDDIKPGVVFIPMHWGKILTRNDMRTNNVTHDLVDPVSKEPDFKFAAVSVRKFEKPVEHLVVAGAGTAALEFIRKYRAKNQTDRITVLSKEKNAFYNRILLPDYVSGILQWNELVKSEENEWLDLNIEVETETAVESIRQENKELVGSNGETYSYDK
ncbi:MAG TPA: molybdopterin-dependent oxidoreductase, partial [Sunxiuqinia sp.]|nr:molybdopterin-dependent oxidoreductase [Sunxiuqinia sp.]